MEGMMQEISVLGINHKTAPIEVRENFFCNPLQQELLLSELKAHPAVVEALVLSTCNRTEIYFHAINLGIKDKILKTLFSVKGVTFSENYLKHFYCRNGQDAVAHLLRVTAGLDSLVLGERQILGQVKEFTDLARKKVMLGKYFNILTNVAITAAKKAHNETDISIGGVSISWAAIAMAEKVLGTLQDKSVLIIGAGKMSELAVEQMRSKGVDKILVMNRTESCAMALAEKCKGTAVSFCDIKEVLAQVDFCICSVGAPHYILEKGTMEKISLERNGRKLIFIDISMPRNIDPQVAFVKDVLLFCLDDLDKVVGDNLKKRNAALADVEKIVAAKIVQFNEKILRLTSPLNNGFEYSNPLQ